MAGPKRCPRACTANHLRLFVHYGTVTAVGIGVTFHIRHTTVRAICVDGWRQSYLILLGGNVEGVAESTPSVAIAVPDGLAGYLLRRSINLCAAASHDEGLEAGKSTCALP